MPRPDDEVPAASSDQDYLSDAEYGDDSAYSPSGRDGRTPAATDDDDEDPRKAIRDLKAQHGREQKEAREREQALAAQIAQQQAYLQQIGQRISQADMARQASILQNLPPEKRAAAELEMLKRQVAALRRGQTAPRTSQGYTEREMEAYTEQRIREMVAEANDDFGLDGDEALSGDETDLDMETEEDFKRSLRRKARQRMLGRDTVASKSSNGSGRSATAGGRSNSARPATRSGSAVDVERESQRIFMQTKNPKQGIMERKKMLRDMGAKARERADRVSAAR